MKRRFFDAKANHEEIGVVNGVYSHRACAPAGAGPWQDLSHFGYTPSKLNNCHYCRHFFNPVETTGRTEEIHFL